MRVLKTTLLLGAILPFFAAAPAQDSEQTPEEQQQTQQLNEDQATQGSENNAVYEQQQEQYQEQQRRYQAEKQRYEEQAERYEAARDRYSEERARYHRYEWPSRYEHLTFVDSDEVIGAPVETYSGRDVGRVENIARSRSGRIDAVQVALDDGDSRVWIDRGDLKYDADDRLLVTDLARHDLYAMAREQY